MPEVCGPPKGERIPNIQPFYPPCILLEFVERWYSLDTLL